MRTARMLKCLLLAFALLGMLSAASATTWNVPAPNGTNDTSNIQSTINGASAGDTISFSSGGQYKVSSKITILSNLTYQGNGCTLNWIATTAGAMFYLNGVTNLTITGFTFNCSAYGGDLQIDCNPNLSSYVTITNNTIENNSYNNQNEWVYTPGICDQGLIDSTVTFNTIHDIAGNDGIIIYEPSNDTFSYNTFYNVDSDCLQICGLNGTTGTGIVLQGNAGTSNCYGCGIEILDGGDSSYPDTTNMLIDSNIFSPGCYNSGNKEMDLSIVNSGTGTTITNNNLTMTNPVYYAAAIELAPQQFTPENALIKNNIISGVPWLYCPDGDYNENALWEYNLFVNIANSPVWGDATTNNCGGAADQYEYNWAYGCTNDLTHYPNNYNMSGSCPTVGIAETSNATVGGANGVFTITSSLAVAQNTSVYYTLSGTGVNGTDYTISPASPATITSGQTSTTVSVHGLNSGKTVIATLAFGPYYINSSAKSATMNINAGSGGGGSLSGSTATASTSTYNLTSLGTTDWSHWNNTGWIHKSAGGSQISNVSQIGSGTYGNYYNSSRNVSWTDGTPTGSNSDDTYYYWCNDTVNAGWTFTVPASTTPQTLCVLWGGAAGAGVKLNAHLSDGSASDYNDAFTCGSSTTTQLEAITYHAASASQTLTITLTNTTGSGPSVDLDAAWLTSTTPTVTVSASPTSINEANGTSTYTVTRTGATTSALTVNYAMSGTAVSGTDYTALSGSVTIASGSSAGTITLNTIDRGLTSGSCTAILTLSTNANYTVGTPSSATVTINDNDIPTVTVSASPTSVNEKGGTSTYTVTRTGSTASALTVNYSMSGTATNGTDYTTLSGSLTIASGSSTGTVTLTTIDRGITSGSVTAILVISSNAGYTIGSPSSATVTINDNDSGSGGSLAGSSAAASTSTYNLTSLGTTDWSHWNNNGWIHKSSGGSQISNVTQFGSGTYGSFNTSSRNVSWTDGTPTTSNADDQYAIYCNDKANAGWTFTVPAGTTSQTLYIMWGGYTGASVKLNAHLSDGSASDYTNTMTLTGSGSDTYLETITYHAASASQTLTITLTNVSGSSASIDLDAAWLVTSSGALSGSTAMAATSTYNLTSLGTTDWSHWNNTGWIHKSSGGSQISNVTQIGGGTYGSYLDSSRNVSWSDGTPTGSNSDDTYYYYCDTTANSGWTFTVPASTTSHTLYILWGGAANASIKLNAHLSDGSAADYTDAFTCSSSGVVTHLETITYHAASASQTLTLTLTTTTSGGPSVDLDAAWLQ